jgi:hypothetical protein
MYPCRTLPIPLLLLTSALALAIAGPPARAAVITLTGGDAADASDGIGYAPGPHVQYAYRITTTGSPNGPPPTDQSAYTYKGVRFDPFILAGNASNPTSPNSSTGSVSINNGFYYPAGAALNAGTGGGAISADDTTLFNIAKYQSFAATTYSGLHGTETLRLGGLSPHGTYQIDIFVANSHGAAEYLYTTTGDNGALPTESVIPTNGIVPGRVYNLRQSVIADINGEIRVVVTDNFAQANDNATINGFSVTFVPEPMGFAVVGLVGAFVATRRRSC